ncbi:hypothetical protein LTR85_000996 [Meristemomyces frigidus]|nr:hypothetical protein LTR85_000996 [Meristemomyces frigidus]
MTFLRRLEYFRGLLFLTTNRVSQIDEAFMSRLHVAIGYKNLTASARKSTWKGFFSKLEKERAGRVEIAQDAKNYVLEDERVELNGREIRNALQTAFALAECEQGPRAADQGSPVTVEVAHFERVLETSEGFHNHVLGLRREEKE